MDVAELVPTAHRLFAAGLAPSTQRVYRTGRERYLKFCDMGGLEAFPARENTLMLFVSHLHTEKLAVGTIKSYLAAVRFEQISRGGGNPGIHSMPRLEYVIKGCKRVAPGTARRRLPITPEILRKLRGVWHKSENPREAKMLWAASCLCFYGFLRSGEVVTPAIGEYDPAVHLCFEDVKVDNRMSPSFIQVSIKASKTDPFRQGVTIYIGATGGQLCPVTAVLSYMVARGSGQGPLFLREDGRYLTRESFVVGVRAALTIAGLKANDYAGHSFRIGAATTAARCGLQDSLIKTLGRWESSAYTRYIRTAPETLCSVAKTLLKD